MSLLDDVATLEAELIALADQSRAVDMTAYLKNRFVVLGVATPERRAAVKRTIDTRTVPERTELIEAIDSLYRRTEREYHYCAVDLARRWQRVLGVDDLDWLGQLVTTHSWWDTVDALAAHPIGHVAHGDPAGARPTLDAWAESDDLWLNRAAILHQLMFKADLDADQLFQYCDLHASSTEFFHRKAIGWALRQHSRIDPGAVLAYVDERRSTLSGLTIREALKHL